MDDKIRFSQFVINAINNRAFTAQRDGYAGTVFGLYSDANIAPNDAWEFWAYNRWFKGPHITLRRNGKYLNYLDKDEKLRLWKAFEAAQAVAKEWETARKIRQAQRDHVNHWWP